MTKIMRYVYRICNELEDAKEYAECYVEHKAKGNMTLANKYKEMALDELKHAMYIHDIAMQEVEELSKVFKPTEEMEEKWKTSHRDYVEKTAWIKQMLAM